MDSMSATVAVSLLPNLLHEAKLQSRSISSVQKNSFSSPPPVSAQRLSLGVSENITSFNGSSYQEKIQNQTEGCYTDTTSSQTENHGGDLLLSVKALVQLLVNPLVGLMIDK
ncbi:hypothetical protein XENTR_v10009692 [Xenopus tropicalis]|nr:hypothetical protein XENTR_v10009692 [Xenopus tropicalis]